MVPCVTLATTFLPSPRETPTNPPHEPILNLISFSFSITVLYSFLNLHFSYNSIEGVLFSDFEQQLSNRIVDTLVSVAKGFSISWWPLYRFRRVTLKSHLRAHLLIVSPQF
jgi:hypothetical protein